MADTLTSFTVIGTALVTVNSVTSTAETCTITVTDLSRTFVRMTNVSTTASVTVSLGAGADPHIAAGIGALSLTLATAQSAYLGASWDASRYKTTSGTIVFTVPTAGTVTFEVGVMTPY
jgi:hypothetical protein